MYNTKKKRLKLITKTNINRDILLTTITTTKKFKSNFTFLKRFFFTTLEPKTNKNFYLIDEINCDLYKALS